MMDLRRAEWRIALLWLGAAGLLFVVLVGQSFSNVYGDKVTDAWGWFLPTMMPTLSLIVGVLVAEGLSKDKKPRRIDRRLVHLATGFSTLYLGLVAVSIVGTTALGFGDPSEHVVETLNLSNLWLAPLQGLVAAVLGVVFRKAE
jgi:membrane protease YdiL (CAAX protease family)